MDWRELLKRLRAGETLTGTELTTLRDALSAALATPSEGEDMDSLARGASETVAAINAFNAAQAVRESARRALASATSPVTLGEVHGRDNQDGTDEVESAGRTPLSRAFLASPALAESRAMNGSGKPTVMVPGEVRALFATTNNPGPRNDRVPGYVPPLHDQPLTVLDLIDRRPTGTNTVEWVQETTAPNAAAEVAEGSAKPEASFTLTLKQDTTSTIAHYVNVTRQAVADDGQLAGYIDGRLSYGLFKRLANQVLNGNGTAPNLRGILQTSGIGTYTAGTATERAVVSIRKAKTVAQLSEYDPDAVVVNPIDWEAVELSSATDGTFIVAALAQQITQRVWGMAVIVSNAITGTVFGTTGGTFLVGAFREGATLWERTGVLIYLTDSHASNFTSNILTLLAELRAALSVWRPAAFVKGTFGASRA